MDSNFRFESYPMPDSNVNDALPKSPEEEQLLKPAVAHLLATIPEVWAPFDTNALTSVNERTLLLLTAAGMVERRIGMRISSVIDQFSAEIEVTATGEYGFVEALQLVIAQMWATAKDVYPEWRATHGEVPSAHCEVLHESWRLTDQGVIARNDLGKTQHDREVVFRFVLRRFFFATRPAVRGSGVLTKFIPAVATPTAPTGVSINNWDDGAKMIAMEIMSQLGEVMAKAMANSSMPKSPVVSLDPSQIVIDGQPYALSSDAAHYLDVLVARYGERMSDRDVVLASEYLQISYGDRPRLKKVRDSLPDAVKAWIDSNESGTKFRRPG